MGCVPSTSLPSQFHSTSITQLHRNDSSTLNRRALSHHQHYHKNSYSHSTLPLANAAFVRMIRRRVNRPGFKEINTNGNVVLVGIL
ncbi:hypothetical protein DdX_13645 [Ditylenchus destructor]|uniref:Uncharacterized protein n=1 Tax=Ditylenchus destructor TaxID=166010 RepID=A0AAD4MVP8_9BILA|nr:hypothetical protein DdX_13645 [Ditylenchus destructor]